MEQTVRLTADLNLLGSSFVSVYHMTDRPHPQRVNSPCKCQCVPLIVQTVVLEETWWSQ